MTVTTITRDENTWLAEADIKAVIAELVGTFLFVFIGAGAVVTSSFIHAAGNGPGLLIAAFANGLALALAITAVGHVSGGHLNPAVTIALWVSQRIASVLAVAYIVAQLVGAILAGLALRLIFSSAIWTPVHLGAPSLAPQVSFGTGVLIEAIMTFFLVFAVFGTAVDPRHPQVGGFGIGLVVFVDVLVAGPLTGAAMNPARAFGPWVAGGYWSSNDLVYWIGPILGAIIASLIYGYVLMPHEDIDIGSAPQVPGDDILPVPAPETNPYLDELAEGQLEGGDTEVIVEEFDAAEGPSEPGPPSTG
ncbi:MAG TPA: MIP/aquaporin family protein [Chloroflexota bacterium]|nr:MIP/aquaporin family protein [Chloroflexota bacterium]